MKMMNFMMMVKNKMQKINNTLKKKEKEEQIKLNQPNKDIKI